jgi:hypothetical protein
MAIDFEIGDGTADIRVQYSKDAEALRCALKIPIAGIAAGIEKQLKTSKLITLPCTTSVPR